MKLWNWLTIMFGMMIFLYFMGFPLTGSKEILNDAGISINETNYQNSTIDVADSNWSRNLFDGTDALLFSLIGLGAVVIGIWGRTVDMKLILLPFMVTFVVKFIRVGHGLVTLVNTQGEDGAGWLIGIIVTVFGTLTAMAVISLVEWFGGSDN